MFYGGPGREHVVKLRRKINRMFFNKWNGNVVWGNELRKHLKDEGEIDTLLAGEYRYIDRFFAAPDTLYNIEKVARELRFNKLEDKSKIGILQQIKSSNSVSIHVRRGDYVGTSFDVVTEHYYKKAIEYIEERVDNPCFFVFSDNTAYVEELFKDIPNKRIVDCNRGAESFRDMQFMSMCKNNIITNSTFSEWGALLNRNKEKMVIYPITPKMETDEKKILLKEWVGIKYQ